MRDLRLQLMTAYYNRGKMLLEAQESGILTQLVQAGYVSNDEAHSCITLYHNWTMFLQAEAWNDGLSRRYPPTPIDALGLIDRWVAAGSPHPLNVRGFIDSLLMAMMSISQLVGGENAAGRSPALDHLAAFVCPHLDEVVLLVC